MTPFWLRPEDQDRLLEAKRLAMANPTPLDTVKRLAGLVTETADGLVRGERPVDVPQPQNVILTFGRRIALSCEEQPPGLFLHLSISSPTSKKTLPHPEAVKMVLGVLGVGDPIKGWIEEFEENGVVGGRAVNVLIAL